MPDDKMMQMAGGDARERPISKVDLHKVATSAVLEAIQESEYESALEGIYVSVYASSITVSPRVVHAMVGLKLHGCTKQSATRDLTEENMLAPVGDIYEALKTFAEDLLP